MSRYIQGTYNLIKIYQQKEIEILTIHFLIQEVICINIYYWHSSEFEMGNRNTKGKIYILWKQNKA